MTTQAVYRYPIAMGGVQTIEMPASAEILHVAWRPSERAYVHLWARVDADESRRVQRRFRVVGTGHPEVLPTDRHLGTVLVDDGAYVFHVFEVHA